MQRGLDFGTWVSQPKQQSRSKSRGHDQAWSDTCASENCSQKGIDIYRYCQSIYHKLHSQEFSTQPRHDRPVRAYWLCKRKYAPLALAFLCTTHCIYMSIQLCRVQRLENTVRVVPARRSKKQTPVTVPFILLHVMAKANAPRRNGSNDRGALQDVHSHK